MGLTFTVQIDTKTVADKVLRKTANEVRKTMIELAKTNLSPKSAKVYTSSLSKVTVSGGTAQFMLHGWLAKAIELGCDPFDMKPGILASPKVKISKKGNPYMRIMIKDSPKVFRVVSSLSKPGSWIHPGILPRDFWGKATYYLRHVK